MFGSSQPRSDLFNERDARSIQRFSVWAMASALLFATATILIGEQFIPRGPLAWVLTAASVFCAAGAVRAYARFLQTADELLRKIHVEGLALGFGAGVIFMLSYRLLERLGAMKLDVNDPVLVMVVFWAVGQWMGFRRYSGDEQP